ncbi:ergic3 [Scenedesmus sp. PABB004]|nr:ergic3 [Scenedesmus sp. PABB004]
MPCSWLSLDAMDISGEMHLDVASHDIKKQRLSSTGAPVSEVEQHDVHHTRKADNATGAGAAPAAGCGSCYGAESDTYKCCTTCDEVRQAYQAKGWVLTNMATIAQCKDDGYLAAINDQAGEGCHMWGHITVNKVAGNFHFAAGHSYQSGAMHIHDMAPFADKTLDFTHTVKALSFGRPYPVRPDAACRAVAACARAAARGGARSSPLPRRAHAAAPPGGAGHAQPAGRRDRGGAARRQAPATGGPAGGPAAPGAGKGAASSGMFQYFLKVVPTDYLDVSGRSTPSNQFSVTENFREAAEPLAGGRSLPGVFFFYDLSPIKVRITEQRSSFLHFLTNVCAIVGGIFASLTRPGSDRRARGAPGHQRSSCPRPAARRATMGGYVSKASEAAAQKFGTPADAAGGAKVSFADPPASEAKRARPAASPSAAPPEGVLKRTPRAAPAAAKPAPAARRGGPRRKAAAKAPAAAPAPAPAEELVVVDRAVAGDGKPPKAATPKRGPSSTPVRKGGMKRVAKRALKQTNAPKPKTAAPRGRKQ